MLFFFKPPLPTLSLRPPPRNFFSVITFFFSPLLYWGKNKPKIWCLVISGRRGLDIVRRGRFLLLSPPPLGTSRVFPQATAPENLVTNSQPSLNMPPLYVYLNFSPPLSPFLVSLSPPSRGLVLSYNEGPTAPFSFNPPPGHFPGYRVSLKTECPSYPFLPLQFPFFHSVLMRSKRLSPRFFQDFQFPVPPPDQIKKKSPRGILLCLS